MMANAAPVPAGRTNIDGFCTYINTKWEAFTGQKREDWWGYGWMHAVHPDDHAKLAPVVDRQDGAAPEPFAISYRLRRADGVWWPVHVQIAPDINPDGEHVGWIGFVTVTATPQTQDAGN